MRHLPNLLGCQRLSKIRHDLRKATKRSPISNDSFPSFIVLGRGLVAAREVGKGVGCFESAQLLRSTAAIGPVARDARRLINLFAARQVGSDNIRNRLAVAARGQRKSSPNHCGQCNAPGTYASSSLAALRGHPGQDSRSSGVAVRGLPPAGLALPWLLVKSVGLDVCSSLARCPASAIVIFTRLLMATELSTWTTTARSITDCSEARAAADPRREGFPTRPLTRSTGNPSRTLASPP